MKVFIKASINDTVIYVKVDDSIIEELVDYFHDCHYKIEASNGDDWDSHIPNNSYEIDTEKEIGQFKTMNLHLIEK